MKWQILLISRDVTHISVSGVSQDKVKVTNLLLHMFCFVSSQCSNLQNKFQKPNMNVYFLDEE